MEADGEQTPPLLQTRSGVVPGTRLQSPRTRWQDKQTPLNSPSPGCRCPRAVKVLLPPGSCSLVRSRGGPAVARRGERSSANPDPGHMTAAEVGGGRFSGVTSWFPSVRRASTNLLASAFRNHPGLTRTFGGNVWDPDSSSRPPPPSGSVLQLIV